MVIAAHMMGKSTYMLTNLAFEDSHIHHENCQMKMPPMDFETLIALSPLW